MQEAGDPTDARSGSRLGTLGKGRVTEAPPPPSLPLPVPHLPRVSPSPHWPRRSGGPSRTPARATGLCGRRLGRGCGPGSGRVGPRPGCGARSGEQSPHAPRPRGEQGLILSGLLVLFFSQGTCGDQNSCSRPNPVSRPPHRTEAASPGPQETRLLFPRRRQRGTAARKQSKWGPASCLRARGHARSREPGTRHPTSRVRWGPARDP